MALVHHQHSSLVPHQQATRHYIQILPGLIENEQNRRSGLCFSNTRFSNTRIHNCNWTNVAFVDCRIEDTVFASVTLNNVLFLGIDFQDVRIKDLCLVDFEWSDMSISRALMGATSENSSQRAAGYPLMALLDLHPISVWLDADSRTIIRVQRRHPPTIARLRDAGFEANALNSWNPRREIIPRQIITGMRRRQKLDDMPKEVFQNIVKMLGWNNETVSLRDLLLGNEWDPPSTMHPPAIQTTYKCQPAPWRRYTYTAGVCDGLIGPFNKFNHETAILLVNWRCYELAAPILYDRWFNCTGSVQACLAFLHDHKHTLWSGLHLNLTLRFEDDVTGSRSDVEAFRKLCDVLVHERTDVARVDVIVRPSFWEYDHRDRWYHEEVDEVVRWEEGAQAIWDSQFHVEGLNPELVYLQQIARLASRVPLEIIIEDATEERQRMEFEAGLRGLMEEKQAHRPYLAVDQANIDCPQPADEMRLLEESCYWKHYRLGRNACWRFAEQAEERARYDADARAISRVYNVDEDEMDLD